MWKQIRGDPDLHRFDDAMRCDAEMRDAAMQLSTYRPTCGPRTRRWVTDNRLARLARGGQSARAPERQSARALQAEFGVVWANESKRHDPRPCREL
jgi:hypothetical protein